MTFTALGFLALVALLLLFANGRYGSFVVAFLAVLLLSMLLLNWQQIKPLLVKEV